MLVTLVLPVANVIKVFTAVMRAMLQTIFTATNHASSATVTLSTGILKQVELS